MVSRDLWTPVRNIVDLYMKRHGNEDSSVPKYYVQSLHDVNVGNVMVNLSPSTILDSVPYAATFVWEVYSLNN